MKMNTKEELDEFEKFYDELELKKLEQLTEEPLKSDCTGEMHIIRKDEYKVHGSEMAYLSYDMRMFDTKEERDARNKLLKEQERRSSIFFKIKVWLKDLFS